MAKHLYRSRTNRKIAGVCGGLADYFDADPIWFRALFLVSILFGGLGIVTYAIFWILTPYQPI